MNQTEIATKTKKLLQVLCVLALCGSSSGFAQDEASNEATRADDTANLQALESYWTTDRMAEATPVPMPELSEEDFNRLFGAGAQAFDEKDADVVSEPSVSEGVAGNPVRANVNAFPYRTGGKLFFTLKGSNYTCSATFVSRDVLLTAAHCVRATDGTWATRVLFRRAYSNGGGQSVGYRCLGTKYGWVAGGSNRWKWDYAFIKTSSNSSAGHIGLRTGIPYNSWESTGYPGNFGGGAYMYKVDGRKGRVANGVVEMLDNPMTFGSSGGSWIGAGRYAIGVNSHIYRNRPGRMYGPIFDSNFAGLYTFVNNGCR